MNTLTTAELLNQAVKLIKERQRDLAVRHLTRWVGPDSLLVIEEPITDPKAQRALEFVKRSGRVVGVRLVKPVKVAQSGTPVKASPQVEAAIRAATGPRWMTVADPKDVEALIRELEAGS